MDCIKMMRYVILILCLGQFQVHANDWLNRTVRVDLIVNGNRRAFDPKFDLLKQSVRTSSGVNATNGQYPWSILTTAWSEQGSGSRVGIPCSGTIIRNHFVLSDFHCVGQDLSPPATSIELYIGSVSWSGVRTPTNFVRHYWYIEPSSEHRSNIVLFRLNNALIFNPNVQPIRLPFDKDFSYDGWSSYILGYSSDAMPHLQASDTSIFDNRLCNFVVAEHEICGIEGSEPYESGSMRTLNSFTGGAWIVYEYTDAGLEFIPVLVGIHQYQYANQTASYGHATRVSHFVEWVETLASEQNSLNHASSF